MVALDDTATATVNAMICRPQVVLPEKVKKKIPPDLDSSESPDSVAVIIARDDLEILPAFASSLGGANRLSSLKVALTDDYENSCPRPVSVLSGKLSLVVIIIVS